MKVEKNVILELGKFHLDTIFVFFLVLITAREKREKVNKQKKNNKHVLTKFYVFVIPDIFTRGAAGAALYKSKYRWIRIFLVSGILRQNYGKSHLIMAHIRTYSVSDAASLTI